MKAAMQYLGKVSDPKNDAAESAKHELTKPTKPTKPLSEPFLSVLAVPVLGKSKTFDETDNRAGKEVPRCTPTLNR